MALMMTSKQSGKEELSAGEYTGTQTVQVSKGFMSFHDVHVPMIVFRTMRQIKQINIGIAFPISSRYLSGDATVM